MQMKISAGLCQQNCKSFYIAVNQMQVKAYYNKITVKIHTLFPSFLRIHHLLLSRTHAATLKLLYDAFSQSTSKQPCFQGLSPLPPLSLGKETLVAADHVNTQTMGGKKICWTGGVTECFDCCCGKLCGFKISSSR